MLFSETRKSHSARITLGVAVALVLGLAACGSPSSDGIPTGSSCPNNVPQSCPSTVPSYTNDVAPIITNNCLQCHWPGGVEEPSQPLQDYNDVFARRQPVLSQVASCRMPQDHMLNPNDRLTLLTWLVCNAP